VPGPPGQIVEVSPTGDFARVDVAGVVRDINLGMLAGTFVPGEYILIHSGVALNA
jgi:hydrogenase expression/formation protein HypC